MLVWDRCTAGWSMIRMNKAYILLCKILIYLYLTCVAGGTTCVRVTLMMIQTEFLRNFGEGSSKHWNDYY